MTGPPTDERRPREGTGVQKATAAASGNVPARSGAAATDAPHERWQCPLWIVDPETGRIVGRCPQHAGEAGQAGAAIEAAAVRGLLVERSWSPGEWTVESVLDAAGLAAHDNTVGGVVRALADDGLIVRVGHAQAERASRHGAAVATWVGARHAADQGALPGVSRRRRGGG
jgi:hypothetical protein